MRESLNKTLSATGRVLRRPVVWIPIVFLGAAGAGIGWGYWENLCVDCPSVAQIHTWEPQQTSKVFSHDGQLIGELGIQRRTPVSIDALPDFVPQAFVAIEDRRFYEHQGYDARGVARAVVMRSPARPLFTLVLGQRLRAGGGSTITQQLARNMFEAIGFEVTMDRKLKELQVSMQLEESYSKDQILEAYMNQINLGPGWWGIQTASRNYFGKNAFELNPAEAALLAAVANRPGFYSPFSNPDRALQRRNLVLDRMAREGFLTREEAAEWMEYPLPRERSEGVDGVAPYFQEWVRQIASARFGPQVYTGGLQIHTTLDLEMQEAAEEAMDWGFERIESRPGFNHPRYEEFADRNEAFDGPNTPYVQGLFVALDPATGQIRALVGGRDFRHSRFNRVTQATRQPGSSFKTFVYAAAMENRIPPSHILVDAPVVVEQVSGEEWRPQNFDRDFQGPMTLRYAFRHSINMVAIRLGMDEVGMETVAQTARRLGIRTPIDRGPATAIGSPDVIPLEMAEAYSTFANLGTRVRPEPILRVESAEGEVLWEPTPDRTQVMDSLAARVTVALMEDVVARGTAASGVRLHGGLPPEVPAAGKTGTTNQNSDVWFVGFTPNLQAAVWFGMDRPQRIYPGATGGADAAPVWGRFMQRVYFGDEGPTGETVARLVSDSGSNGEDGDDDGDGGLEDRMVGGVLPVPEPWPLLDLVTLEVDDQTGLLASEWCPPERRYMEIFIPGTEPTEECDESGPSFFRSPRRP